MINVIENFLFKHKISNYSLSFIFKKNFSQTRKYFNILQIKENSSKEEIKEAYLKLVKQHHPDLKSNNKNYFSCDKEKEEIPFYEIQNAYEQLISQLDRKADKYDMYNHKEKKIDDIIEVIIKAGINSGNEKKEDRKKLQPDKIFYPLYGIKMDKEDILNLKQIIKRINYKIYKRKLKSEEIRNQNEKININVNNFNLNYVNSHNERADENYINKINDNSSDKIPLSSILFLRITKMITFTGLSIFFIINFGIYIGSAISLYVIYLSFT